MSQDGLWKSSRGERTKIRTWTEVFFSARPGKGFHLVVGGGWFIRIRAALCLSCVLYGGFYIVNNSGISVTSFRVGICSNQGIIKI